MNTIAILAGGLATRLYPITRTIPKSLVEINGHPFIHWQLELLKKSGYENIHLCVGFESKQIVELLGSGSSYGLNIQYSFDGKHQLGTGGAILNALENLGDNFSVIYGDSYLPINYKDIEEEFRKSNKKSLMTIFQNNDELDVSNVEYNGSKIIKYSKNNSTAEMKYIDYGFGCYKAKVFDVFEAGSYLDLSDVMSDLVDEGETAVFEVSERFYEIGSFQGIADFENYLKGITK